MVDAKTSGEWSEVWIPVRKTYYIIIKKLFRWLKKPKRKNELNGYIIFVKRWEVHFGFVVLLEMRKGRCCWGAIWTKAFWGDGDEHLWFVMADGWCVFVFFWLAIVAPNPTFVLSIHGTNIYILPPPLLLYLFHFSNPIISWLFKFKPLQTIRVLNESTCWSRPVFR